MKPKINTLDLCLICLGGLIMSVVPAFSLEIVPFDSVNQSPVVSIYGLPGSGNHLLLSAGSTEMGINTALASNFVTSDKQGEQIILDGETTRVTITVRHALLHGLELGIKVPYVTHDGGFLDSFISNYDSAIGFANSGREEAPSNRLLYKYSKNGIDRLLVDSSGSGIGDIQMTVGIQLYEDRALSKGLSLNLGVKLPTGDSDELMGSGNTDISLGLSGGTDIGEVAGRWLAYGSAGVLYISGTDILEDQKKSWVSFGSIGLGWSPSLLPRLVFKVQADAHTAFYSDSALEELADASVQLDLGGTVSLWEGSNLDIGVGEDLAVDTSPDVVFYLKLRQKY